MRSHKKYEVKVLKIATRKFVPIRVMGQNYGSVVTRSTVGTCAKSSFLSSNLISSWPSPRVVRWCVVC
jgi:hypothetical protein